MQNCTVDEMHRVEFYPMKNHMKTSYWSVILDEMTRGGNPLLEKSHENELLECNFR